jgi:hypothetical protein
MRLPGLTPVDAEPVEPQNLDRVAVGQPVDRQALAGQRLAGRGLGVGLRHPVAGP